MELAAAAVALREEASLPSLSGARTERYLAAARGLGTGDGRSVVEAGIQPGRDAAVDLALTVPDDAAAGADSGSRPRPGVKAQAPGGLTPRELEIVALIAEGHSNKGIGEQLVISPATAARHVANILLKLGFSSRAQVAAWATRQAGRNGRADAR